MKKHILKKKESDSDPFLLENIYFYIYILQKICE